VGGATAAASGFYSSAGHNSDRPMNKPEPSETGLPISGLLRQAIAFVRDFAALPAEAGS
jgi:hypothetical protein